MTPSPTRQESDALASRPSVYRVQWAALAVVGVLGALMYGVLSARAGRAGLSFLGGVLVAGAAFTAGIAAIRWAGRVSPVLMMLVGMLTYLTIVVALAAVLASADPDVVDAPAFALGLVSAVAVWIVEQSRASWPAR